MKKSARVAIPFALAVLVSACGGGGGGSSSDSTQSTTAPATAPAPAAAPTNILQAGALQPFGPFVLASNVGNSTFDKGIASSARLIGGGAVVAWSTGTSVLVQRLDGAGNPVGAPQTVGPVLTGDLSVSTRLSVAATADGGWVIAWTSPDRNVLFRRYDASGAPFAASAPVDAVAFASVLSVRVKALADGGFVVAWVAAEGTSASRAFIRRFSAAGTPVTDPRGASSTAGAQPGVEIAPRPDGTFLVAWVQSNPDGTDSLLARQLDASLNPSGPAQVVQPPGNGHPYAFLSSASLSQGTVLFAWAYDNGATVQARWQLLDALGVPTIPSTSATSSDSHPGRLMDSIEVVPAAAGFRIVAESTEASSRFTDAFTTLIDVSAAGALVDQTETSRALFTASGTTGAGCSGPRFPGVAAAGGEDGRYVLAYATCPTNIEVVGR